MLLTVVLLYTLAFCRFVIGLVFMVSSVSKLLYFAQFRKAVRNFNILPQKLSNITAMLFLCSEFSVVLLVVIGGSLLTVGFSLAIFLLLIFSCALVLALIRKTQVSCSCFGSSVKRVSYIDVWRNIGFILCALAGGGILIWSRATQGELSLIEWGLTGLGAAAFVAFWVQLGEIAPIFRQAYS